MKLAIIPKIANFLTKWKPERNEVRMLPAGTYSHPTYRATSIRDYSMVSSVNNIVVLLF